jgi:hypothetical protein
MNPMTASTMAIPSQRTRRIRPTTTAPKSSGFVVLPQKQPTTMASHPAMAKVAAVQSKPFMVRLTRPSLPHPGSGPGLDLSRMQLIAPPWL